MIFEYNGTEYEFPDDMQDDEALRLIRADQGEVEQPEPVQPKQQSWTNKPLFPGAKNVLQQNVEGFIDPIISSVKNAYNSVTQADEKDVQRMMDADTPIEKGLAVAGTVARDIGDVAAVPFNIAAGWADKAIPQGVKDYVKNDAGVQAVGKGVMSVAEKIKQAPSWVKDLAEIGFNLPFAGVVGKVGTKAVSDVAKKAGEGVEEFGKKAYAADLKINKPVARKAYGKSLKEKQNTIVNTIFDEGLDSEGSFENAYAKGRSIADQLDQESKQIIESASSGEQKFTINPVKIIEDVGKKQAASGAWGTQQNAQSIVDRIVDDAKAAGFDKEMPLSGLIEAKKNIDDGSVFSNGARFEDADRVNQQIRKAIYLDMVDKAAEIAEKSGAGNLRDLGKRQKKLIDALSALDDAAYRVEKKNVVSLTDQIIGTGGLASTVGSLAAGSPEMALYSILTSAGVIGTKKALEQGRGGSAIARGGKALQNAATDNVFKGAKNKPSLKTNAKPQTPITDENRLLPAPMVGGEDVKYDPMLPTMGERLKSIGTGEQNRFKMPDTKSTPKKEPIAFDIQGASQELTTLPQLKAATKNILENVPLTGDEKSRMVDFMRYLNGIDEKSATWPKQIDSYVKRMSKKYNMGSMEDAMTSYMKKNPKAPFNEVFNALKKEGYEINRSSLYKQWKESK